MCRIEPHTRTDFDASGLSSMAEPSHIVYEVENSDLDSALAELRALVLPQTSQDDGITTKCMTQRIAHISAIDQALSNTVRYAISYAGSTFG